MTNKSNLDVAYDVVSGANGSIAFMDLWKKVAEIQELPEDQLEGKIGKFYTNLLLDGRFVNLGDNVWDLRERNTFDKVHIDMTDCYTDEEEDIDPEEVAEEKEAGEIIPTELPEGTDAVSDEPEAEEKETSFDSEEEI